jgi:NitT/TauT family transport system substrate-binding protein
MKTERATSTVWRTALQILAVSLLVFLAGWGTGGSSSASSLTGRSANTSSANSSSPSMASTTSVNLGTEPWIGYGPWWIAQKKGFFTKEGLSVNIVTFQQDADRNSALASGRTPFSNIDTGRTVQMVENQHLKIHTLLLLDDSEGADAMIANNSIHSIKDLRGKSVAYEQGTTSDLLLHYVLLKAHIPFNAIHSVYIPAANAATALVAGKVPVAVTYEPYISNVLQTHHAAVHVVYSSANVPGLIGDYLTVNTPFLQAHKDVARRLLRAWNDSMNYWKAHPSDGTAIMAAGVGSTTSSLKSTLRGVKIYTVGQNRQLFSSGVIQKRYLLVGSVLASEGVVKHTVSPSQVVDLSYLPR